MRCSAAILAIRHAHDSACHVFAHMTCHIGSFSLHISKFCDIWTRLWLLTPFFEQMNGEVDDWWSISVFGCWLSVFGLSVLVCRCSMIGLDYRLSIIGFRFIGFDLSMVDIRFRLSVIGLSVLICRCSMIGFDYRLSVIDFVFFYCRFVGFNLSMFDRWFRLSVIDFGFW